MTHALRAAYRTAISAAQACFFTFSIILDLVALLRGWVPAELHVRGRWWFVHGCQLSRRESRHSVLIATFIYSATSRTTDVLTGFASAARLTLQQRVNLSLYKAVSVSRRCLNVRCRTNSPGARFSKLPKNFLIFSEVLPKSVLSVPKIGS